MSHISTGMSHKRLTKMNHWRLSDPTICCLSLTLNFTAVTFLRFYLHTHFTHSLVLSILMHALRNRPLRCIIFELQGTGSHDWQKVLACKKEKGAAT